jgi:polar amino acid transport system substrate-binding protein
MKTRSKLTRLALAGAAISLMATGCSGGAGAASSTSSTKTFAHDGATVTPGVIRVATTGDSKPNSFVTDGKQQGFDVDVVNAIAKANGYTTEYVTMDFSNILSTVANGQADLGANSISITPARLKNVDFSDPYYIGFASITTTERSGINDPKGLSDKRVGFLKGSIYEGYTHDQYPAAEAVAFPDLNSVMQALSTGTIDGYFGDLPPVQDFMAKNPKEGIKVLSKQPVSDWPVGAVITKGNKEMTSMMNEGLKDLVKTGEWEALYKQWFPDQPIPDMFKQS